MIKIKKAYKIRKRELKQILKAFQKYRDYGNYIDIRRWRKIIKLYENKL
jgi:predicted adenine nucleotide alpha hydrolase (AANH) superfamily ATPase